MDITTDKYPAETAWTLTNNCATSPVVNDPGYPIHSTSYSNTYCLPPASYTLTITDTYGDGNCCTWGSGSYSVNYEGGIVASGGAFGKSESTTFGKCAGGPPPTLNPTPNPTTANPTPNPTPNPTTANPTPTPTTLPPTPTGGALVATFVPSLGVPKCSAVGTSCTSGLLLDGKHDFEPNHPNTLDSCNDGADGIYHSDGSLDKITVSAVGGGQLQAGGVAEIQTQVYAWRSGEGQTADFYYAASAYYPVWTLIGSLPASGGGLHTLTVQYTLPPGAEQAVRVNFRYAGAQSACFGGSWDDVDDLAFSVGTGSGMVTGALQANPVPELNPLQSGLCATLDDQPRCDGFPVCEWQNGNCSPN